MAAPLRYPLILLAWGAMAAIYLPLLPAAGELVGAARSPANWRALFADPQLSQALAATLVSTLLSVGGALLIALTIVAALWPSARWRRLASRLPLLLAVPHLALATAALLLFAFIGTGSSFLAFAALAARHQIANPGYAHKSLYYL
ncbi:hypothetical protein M2950_15370, partial [Klebsiella pneumoniae]|nr:hypothetical protein [Klebsiella pneumoniae]